MDLKGLPQILAEELKVFHRRADSDDLSQRWITGGDSSTTYNQNCRNAGG